MARNADVVVASLRRAIAALEARSTVFATGARTATVGVSLVAGELAVVAVCASADPVDAKQIVGTVVAISAAAVQGTSATRAAAVHVRLVAVLDAVFTGRCRAKLAIADARDAVLASPTAESVIAGRAGSTTVDVGLVAVLSSVVASRVDAAAVHADLVRYSAVIAGRPNQAAVVAFDASLDGVLVGALHRIRLALVLAGRYVGIRVRVGVGRRVRRGVGTEIGLGI